MKRYKYKSYKYLQFEVYALVLPPPSLSLDISKYAPNQRRILHLQGIRISWREKGLLILYFSLSEQIRWLKSFDEEKKKIIDLSKFNSLVQVGLSD